MSKNLKSAIEKIEKNKEYSIEEAIKLAKELSFEKFDSSIEISFNLNLDTKKVEQQLRGSIVFPNATGKQSKVLVITDDVKSAKDAGANYAGGVELLQKIKTDNWFDFNFIVTSPKFMPELAKYGRILGPKGLMPNPKLGTVTNDINKAIENIKKGQLEYKTDKAGIVNILIGKKSFTDKKLLENYIEIFNLIKTKKPSTVKGEYIKAITLSTSMGPGIKILKNL